MHSKRRGMFELSFSMIFSIIVIIAILGVSFYVIAKFWDFNKCSKTGLFYNSIEGEIEKAWKSSSYRDEVSFSVASGISEVCFGAINSTVLDSESRNENEILRKYFSLRAQKNLFLYPPEKACTDLESRNLEHVDIDGFFCIPVIKGEITIKLEKGNRDALVSVKK